jgi:uncharacterized membrane protein YgdD (TMEM256/DUF423 family)
MTWSSTGAVLLALAVALGAFGAHGLRNRLDAYSMGLLLAGIVLFSGSLYLLAVTGNRILGAITPLGGVSFIAAWLMLAWFLLRR